MHAAHPSRVHQAESVPGVMARASLVRQTDVGCIRGSSLPWSSRSASSGAEVSWSSPTPEPWTPGRTSSRRRTRATTRAMAVSASRRARPRFRTKAILASGIRSANTETPPPRNRTRPRSARAAGGPSTRHRRRTRRAARATEMAEPVSISVVDAITNRARASAWRRATRASRGFAKPSCLPARGHDRESARRARRRISASRSSRAMARPPASTRVAPSPTVAVARGTSAACRRCRLRVDARRLE